MDRASRSSTAWFKDPRLLLASAACVAAIAVAAAAVGIASARTNHRPAEIALPNGELSVVMQTPRETSAPLASPGKMETLDPSALREQAASALSSDPEGDENLKIIDAQERRLQAMNDKEAAAFAVQIRQTESEDGVMAREVRATNAAPATRTLSTSNTTDGN